MKCQKDVFSTTNGRKRTIMRRFSAMIAYFFANIKKKNDICSGQLYDCKTNGKTHIRHLC